MVFIKVYLNQLGSRIKSQQTVNKPKKTKSDEENIQRI